MKKSALGFDGDMTGQGLALISVIECQRVNRRRDNGRFLPSVFIYLKKKPVAARKRVAQPLSIGTRLKTARMAGARASYGLLCSYTPPVTKYLLPDLKKGHRKNHNAYISLLYAPDVTIQTRDILGHRRAQAGQARRAGRIPGLPSARVAIAMRTIRF